MREKMIRINVETGMCFINNTYPSRNILLYILESNDKYIECWKIDNSDMKDRIFRIGSDWDKTMSNYYDITEDEFIKKLFGGQK